jgi:phage FluMu protein Com
MATIMINEECKNCGKMLSVPVREVFDSKTEKVIELRYLREVKCNNCNTNNDFCSNQPLPKTSLKDRIINKFKEKGIDNL